MFNKKKDKNWILQSCQVCLNDLQVVYLKNIGNFTLTKKLNQLFITIEQVMQAVSLSDAMNKRDYQLILANLEKARSELQILYMDGIAKKETDRLDIVLVRVNSIIKAIKKL